MLMMMAIASLDSSILGAASAKDRESPGGWEKYSGDPATAEPIQGLIERLLPGHGREFVIETIPAPQGQNLFEVEGKDGKIVLRGDGALSQAVALNWYLKHDAMVSVSWYVDDPVNVPQILPKPVEKVRKTTRLKQRFFLNYCTFGYTMPFWRWRDWERFIDWMALNGINLPLAQNGNEYIWQNVWRQYGLSDDEIRTFFTGPAHLPWHRMVNIDKWNGPLPQSYIDGQRDLQKQILARERELGQTPVLCAFSGHVPEALKGKQPSMKIERIPPGWAGFNPRWGTWFLHPDDPNFKEIQVKFLKEQEKEYGTDHFYGTDPFNEIDPPSWEPTYLAGVSKAIYDGMAEVDPAAVWLQMAWTFQDLDRWNEARLGAMIQAVPPGRMVLIDYVCENRELYKETKAFYGAPFLWDYLGNFGGNTHLVGPINKINQRVTEAMNNASLKNFVGVGGTLEGLNNPVVYELLFDRIWQGETLDLKAWVQANARARAGGADASVEQAWDVLGDKVLSDSTDPIGNHGAVYQAHDPSLHGGRNGSIDYGNKYLIRAWELFLKAAPATRASSAYKRDLVDTTRQALGNLAEVLLERMAAAYDKKDAAEFERASKEFMTLGRDIDQFLGTKTEFMLGKWIDDAKSWAANEDEKAYYEENARMILTTWGGYWADLADYAERQWSGLMRDYYLPRWQLLIDSTLMELKGGQPLDRGALEKRWRDHEWRYATTRSGGTYPTKPSGDYYEMSRAMFVKYSSLAAMAH